MIKAAKYEWKNVLTEPSSLTTALNELEQKINWDIFSIFSTSPRKHGALLLNSKTVVIVLRRRCTGQQSICPDCGLALTVPTETTNRR